MYKVKNKTKQVRKFRDRHLGKDIYVEANKYVLASRPPKENEVWSVTLEKEKKSTNIEKTEKEDQLNDKEVKTWQQ